MKTKYGWCFPQTAEEIADLWERAILTVDANVLLDLYRYHEDTRNALLDALKGFEGRIWLSHQTAEEFFRNRKKVIVSSGNSFTYAEGKLSDIQASATDPINRIKGNRIVPDSIAEDFNKALDAAVDKALEEIKKARNDYPDFLQNDPILEALSKLFDGAVGEPFDEDELKAANQEGKRRVERKIPPGFMDAKKDGDGAYGDYIMWRQILQHAESERMPVIFVTSEGKEDWWEKAYGQTTGLHYALQKEAYEASGERLLAYRTDRFFRYSEEFKGESNESAAEEISALVKARSTSMPLVRIISQYETLAIEHRNEGALSVDLQRPAYKFTCSGHLHPNMRKAPVVWARLVESPDGVPKHIVKAGAGTTFDFNIHLKSVAYEEHLPPGEYIFEYGAEVGSKGDDGSGEGEI